MSNTAIVLYPHQLYHPDTKWFSTAIPIYLVEESLLLSEFPTHQQKLLLHRLSMKAYERELNHSGFTVHYQDICKQSRTDDVYAELAARGITDVIVADTTDNWLEKRIESSCRQYKLTRQKPESELFWLSKAEACERYQTSKKHLAGFYKKLRLDKGVLLTKDSEPVGGEWSFDEQNRKRLPKNTPLPNEPTHQNQQDPNQDEARTWLKSVPGNHYGSANIWLPYTRSGAADYLNEFIKDRLSHFGDYEDAISSTHTRLFHSTLSPLINIGLLSVDQVLEAVLSQAEKQTVPLNSVEGFVRQVIGWREFVRAAYEVDGTTMRTKNFFNHKNDLPEFFWTGQTDITPLKQCLYSAINFGYNHHIERLMVLGNFLLLTRTNPDEVYKWFMGMYVDAYDWVMVPNVYGMSQFADGGIFATKPYLSGSNYLKKMSDYEAGPWEELWTALYWEFIKDHSRVFAQNHRLSMMPKLLAKLANDKKVNYSNLAQDYLKTLRTEV